MIRNIKVFLLLFALFFVTYSNGYCFPGEDDEELPNQISRLSTHEEHVEALENAFKSAKHSIVVTNYGKLYPTILKTPLFTKHIPEACQRNVKIYLRLNYDDERSAYPPIPGSVEEYFCKHGIDVARIKTHAKIVSVDHKQVMMGSFNWLSELTSPYKPQPYNSTFVYEGGQAYRMAEDIWGVLKYYRNREFPDSRVNCKKAFLFKRNPDNQVSKIYPLEDGSTLTYVPVIEEHRRNLLDIFERAKSNITIVSPFVSWDGRETYQRDFVQRLLTTVLERGVCVCFVCLPEQEGNFRSYLGSLLNYPNLKLLRAANLHAKTIIMDESLIAEGSFNWLCAARDEVYRTHKHEATLIYEGPQAKHFIDSFYQSEPGKLVLQVLRDVPSSSLNNKKRKLHRKSSQEEVKESPQSEIAHQNFFTVRRMEVERDIWVHDPFWIQYTPGYISRVYGQYFEVISGERVGREGYCVRVNKRYLTDDSDNILYYDSQKEAKDATFDLRRE